MYVYIVLNLNYIVNICVREYFLETINIQLKNLNYLKKSSIYIISNFKLYTFIN